MGRKSIPCFSWYKRHKDWRRIPAQPTGPSVEQTPLPPPLSWADSGEVGGAGQVGGARQVYFFQKARVTYRHQMDGNIIDATC